MAKERIELDRLLYTHYQHPELVAIKKFAVDFGLVEVPHDEAGLVYFRGFGEEPYIHIAEQSPDSKKHFVGGGWLVKSHCDLLKAAKLPGASPCRTLKAPGGGYCVDIEDPNGVGIRLIHGIKYRLPRADERPVPIVTNTWVEKPRKGQFQRFSPGPSRVHKLGHYGLLVDQDQFIETLRWYESTFNLSVSDAVYNPVTGRDMMSFFHIDKDDEFTDHHSAKQSFFLCAPPNKISGSRAHHSSFEITDTESQTLGHWHLQKEGWTNCWGIGRHLLGSQIFDYWFDPSGNILEHYSDGDLVNFHTTPTRVPAAPDTMAVWGPNVSLSFLNGEPSIAAVDVTAS